MKPATTLALVALAASLGGCKSFVQAFDFSRHSGAPQYAVGQGDLDEGKALLRSGNVGNALAPLHRAALNPVTQGEALNALGVAYARLGRADLAERFFIAATRYDAASERYAANLDRFYRSELARDTRLAHAQRERARTSYAEYAAGAQGTEIAPIVDQRMVMSSGEARTITISNAAVSTRVTRGKLESAGTVSPAPKPRVRLSSADAVQPQPSSQRQAEIRLTTQPKAPAPRVRVGSAAQPTAYPLRVKLAPRAANPSKD